VPRLLLRLRSAWRRSIQLRVVATTLLVSAIVTTGLGLVLADQVGKGVVDAKRRAALAEFNAGAALAQSQVSQSDATTQQELDQLLSLLVQQLTACQTGGYRVELLPTGPPANRDSYVGCGKSASAVTDAPAVPASLRTAVAGQQVEASAYARLPAGLQLPFADDGTRTFVVGAPLTVQFDGEQYELYFVFPLGTEQQTLSLVDRTLALGGAVLVVLLAVIAAIVTRQVVTPVRLAAQIASRLSAGRLHERMDVRGEDDLARLGSAFNDMARNLQRQIGQLEELSRVQRRFTADVSHELRTPLTTVRMAADILFEQRGTFTPDVARSAELLAGELDRFEALLADLLEISRYDARAAVPETAPTDVAALVRQEVSHVRPLAADRGSDLVIDGVPLDPVWAEVDARRVARIVRNLLTNALEHGEGRPVEVEVVGDDETVGLRVRDHGVGILPGQAAQVFGRFWRGDPSRARRSGGTGLGLAIALEDARLHGGWLQAWGQPGRGAAFRLVLPRTAGGVVRHPPLPLEPTEVDA